MSYFSHRNKYTVEYSGHEEVSANLRNRINTIISKYVEQSTAIDDPHDNYFIDKEDFVQVSTQEFPGRDPFQIIIRGDFHEVFTIVEIFLDMLKSITGVNQQNAIVELVKAFRLSGSVYAVSSSMTIELNIDKDAAEKLEQTKQVLKSTPSAYKRFFEAVGNLLGRNSKPEDIVKNIYIATENYFKVITSTSKFGGAIKSLFQQGIINKEQKGVLEKLNEYGSDSIGVRHHGSSPSPTESQALWFIETISAQLRFIHQQKLKLTKVS